MYSTPQTSPSMMRMILALALPNIVSNISVPLLSMSDTAMAGRLDTVESLGAVTLGTTVVNFSFWLWGFLRMATTGLTAQAYGRGQAEGMTAQLVVGSAFALLGGVFVLCLSPMLYGMAHILSPGVEQVGAEAIDYMRVAYWGAPAALLLYICNGWFVGMQNTVIPMWTTIFSNLLNIVLSYLFTWPLGMGLEGIALGTVVAQYVTVVLLFVLARWSYADLFVGVRLTKGLLSSVLKAYLRVASSIIPRTLALGSISLLFVRVGAEYGAVALGANALLMQLFTCFAYFMDGFAYAGEALTGRFVGAGDGVALRRMLVRLFQLGGLVSLVMGGLYLLGAEWLLRLLSDQPDVLSHALDYVGWTALIPLAAFAAFLWDGVFVGAMKGVKMLQAVLLGWVVFVGLLVVRDTLWGLHTLWLAFVLYLFVRSLCATYLGVRTLR